MMIMSLLLITTFSIAQSHFLVSANEDLHQEAYYLAESGMNYAMDEFREITRQAFEECISEFKWDPLKNPLQSVQEAAQSYVKDKLGPKFKKIMNDKGYLYKLPSPVLANIPENAKISVLIQFFSTENPLRIRISSRGEIGKIRRRIDSQVVVNKISGYFSSLLFDFVHLSGGDFIIKNGGQFETEGELFIKGNLLLGDNSLLYSNSSCVVNGGIYLQDNSVSTFSDDVICRSVHVDGEQGSKASFLSDLYTYGEISAIGKNNKIDLDGVLYACPDEEGVSVGVVAGDGGNIVLRDMIYINGTLNYPDNQGFLFGSESIPVRGEVFKSVESIGGWNSSFYFPDFIPEYAIDYFRDDFTYLDMDTQGTLLYDYLNTPPSEDSYLPSYLQHIMGINTASIKIMREEGTESEDKNELLGYTSGLVFANNQVKEASGKMPSNNFFNDILLKMKTQTVWDYSSQLNPTIEVTNQNIVIDGNSFSILDEDKPFIYITPDEKDIIMPAGSYEGILITNGSIFIESSKQVEHTGLLISGNDLVVEGSLKLYKDKDVLLELLSQEDESFRRFFRVEPEAELFEIRFSKEVLYNMQW